MEREIPALLRAVDRTLPVRREESHSAYLLTDRIRRFVSEIVGYYLGQSVIISLKDIEPVGGDPDGLQRSDKNIRALCY